MCSYMLSHFLVVWRHHLGKNIHTHTPENDCKVAGCHIVPLHLLIICIPSHQNFSPSNSKVLFVRRMLLASFLQTFHWTVSKTCHFSIHKLKICPRLNQLISDDYERKRVCHQYPVVHLWMMLGRLPFWCGDGNFSGANSLLNVRGRPRFTPVRLERMLSVVRQRCTDISGGASCLGEVFFAMKPHWFAVYIYSHLKFGGLVIDHWKCYPVLEGQSLLSCKPGSKAITAHTWWI